MKLPDIEGIEAAAARLAAHLKPTPLLPCPTLSEKLRREVWIKLETASPIGSFKLRGALCALLASRMTSGCAVTSSTGNHGQGLAWAARLVGMNAVVFVPERPNPAKAAKMRLLGAEVREVGRDIDDAKQAARHFATASGAVFVDDGEDLAVMEGAGTVGLEIGRERDDISLVLVPTGGGNLLGGLAAGLKGVQPGARVIGVQPAAAAAMHDSFHAGIAIARPVHTVAECLAQREPAVLALAAVRSFADDLVTVSDDDLFAASHALALYAHVLAEPGSAAGLAALVRHPDRMPGTGRVVLVVTGANLDPATFARMAATPPLLH